MRDKLIVVYDDRQDAYRIQWQIEMGGDWGVDLGVCLGEGETEQTVAQMVKTIRVLPKTKLLQSEFEHDVATVAVATQASGFQWTAGGFSWGVKGDATRALNIARTAIREFRLRCKQQEAEIPWPDWAIKAKAAGWMPPKHWRP